MNVVSSCYTVVILHESLVTLKCKLWWNIYHREHLCHIPVVRRPPRVGQTFLCFHVLNYLPNHFIFLNLKWKKPDPTHMRNPGSATESNETTINTKIFFKRKMNPVAILWQQLLVQVKILIGSVAVTSGHVHITSLWVKSASGIRFHRVNYLIARVLPHTSAFVYIHVLPYYISLRSTDSRFASPYASNNSTL